MRVEILVELRRRVAHGLDVAPERAARAVAAIDTTFDLAEALSEIEALRTVRRREHGTDRLVSVVDIRLGEDLADKDLGVPVGVVMPGDEDVAEDGVSTINRTWEVVVGLSVPAGSDDPWAWLGIEAALAAVQDEVESDRRLGGRLSLDIVRGEVGPVVREAGGAVVGVSISYELTYALPGLGVGDPWLDPSAPVPAGASQVP